MPARTITVESPTEITVNAIIANVSTTLTMKEVPTVEQVLRATMHLSPKQVFVGELSDDPQRTAEFLASIEAQCNKSE
jgi:type II secretory ATPase GspE/PulE/Tfp pilus assembly ATPase PilB-like protein